MRFSTFFLVPVAALVLSAGAHADTFTGSATFIDSTAGNRVKYSGSFADPNFTFAGTLGSTFSDLLTLTPTDNRPGNGVNAVSDAFSISLVFTLPNVASGIQTGTGTISGHPSSATNTITWGNGGVTTFTFTDGSSVKVSIANFTFPGDHSAGSENLVFTVLSNPTPIVSRVSSAPEPSSLALFGTGLLGLGGVIRKRFAK